jgi:uncharacterized membrane protein YgcG
MASRGLNLNAIQVSAGILATLTGAIAASFLGVGGTLVGAAVGSIASTVGGEVYKHYLERTHERLRGAVDVRRYRTARSAAVGRADPAVAQNRTGVTSRREDDGADAAETQVFQVPGRGAPGQGGVTAHRTTSSNDPAHDSPTETSAAAEGLPEAMPAEMAAAIAGAAAASDGQGGSGGEGDSGGTGGSGGRGKRPRWLVLTAITVGTFLVAIAVITVIELSVGKNLHAIVTNQSGGGTTVGGVVGSSNTKPTQAPTHTAAATPSSTPSAAPSSSVPASPTSSSNSGGATPTPSSTLTPGGPNVPAPAVTASP